MKTLLTMVGIGLNTLALVAPRRAGRYGFKLFCRPFRTPLKAHHRSFLDSSQPVTFRYQDNRIQGYRWGDGTKKILFLHGWQSHTCHWKRYVEAFPREEYTLYAFDAPGHGLSSGHFLTVPLYAGLIESFLRNQGEMDAVISHSLGGFSMLYALYTRPLLPVKKLVVLASPGEAKEFFAFYQQSLGLSERCLDYTRHHFTKIIGKPPQAFSAPVFAASVTVPGLIVHDENDEETPFRNAQLLHQAWSSSRFIPTRGLGHMLKSASVVQDVYDFVREES